MTSGPHSSIDHNEFEDAIMSSRCSSSSSFADAKSTDSGTTQEIVAASTAIMGENVVDSPTTHKLLLLKHRSALVANTPTTPSMDYHHNQHDQPHASGIVSQGLDWARKQRDKRQRDYLQQQAETQLRKIREAQANPEQAITPTATSSIFENSTFRNLFSLPNTDHPKKNDERIDTQHETDEHVSKRVSKSGGGYSVQLPIQVKEQEDASFIPPVRIQPEEDNSNPFLLTPTQRQHIAETVLPRGISYAKWKRLYSLARDGDSFACCLRHVGVHKPTLLVVTTTRGASFGGLADAPWNQHSIVPQYYGGSTACLFRVLEGEDRVQAYPWTGANRYIQLCDTQHSMLAFGGGDGGFGLAVSQDFTVGSTGRSATFGNDPLCDQDTFEVLDVEIYGFMTGQF